MKRVFSLSEMVVSIAITLFAGVIIGVFLYHHYYLPDTRLFSKVSGMYSISKAPINGYIEISPTDNSLIIRIVDTSGDNDNDR